MQSKIQNFKIRSLLSVKDKESEQKDKIKKGDLVVIEHIRSLYANSSSWEWLETVYESVSDHVGASDTSDLCEARWEQLTDIQRQVWLFRLEALVLHARPSEYYFNKGYLQDTPIFGIVLETIGCATQKSPVYYKVLCSEEIMLTSEVPIKKVSAFRLSDDI